MTQIHRTTYQIEVISEGPYEPAQRGDNDPFELLAIHYDITEGSCVGNVERVSSTIVVPEKVKEALLDVGNDGEFFTHGESIIEDRLVGHPDGWYVFSKEGTLISGPYDDERDADAESNKYEGDWIGQYDGGYLDFSYAPEGIPS